CAGVGTAQETNERFRYLLDHGQTGLSTAFDMPSLMGHDSDHPRSLGEVGREGVAIDTLEDMETLFGGIPLDQVSVSMTINAPAAIMLAFYIVAAERQGVPPERLAGTIQTDILKEYIAQKEWCFPVDPSLRLVTDMIEFCSRRMPRWHPISISGYHIREAGSTAQQPLVNVVRTAVEALASVLGGTQSLHTNSYDEALALPTEEAVRIALRTQQVIAHETGVTNTIDPLGGAYFIEALTDQMEGAAYGYFRKIDELGGMVEAIKQNYPQR